MPSLVKPTPLDRLLLLMLSEGRNLFATILAVSLALGWIIGAAYYKWPETAGRGGAVAIAISFYLLFIGGDLGSVVYDVLQKGQRTPEAKIEALIARIDTDAAVTRRQNIYLAISSVSGTLTWGFGDLLVPYVPEYLIIKFGSLVTFFSGLFHAIK